MTSWKEGLLQNEGKQEVRGAEAPALGILGNRNGIGNSGLQKIAQCFLFSHEYRFTLRRRRKENISLGDCFLLDYPDR